MNTTAKAIYDLRPGDWILLAVLLCILAAFAAFLIISMVKILRPRVEGKGARVTFGQSEDQCHYHEEHEQSLQRLETTTEEIRANVKMLYRTMLPLLQGVKASLEAAKGQVNGNVEKAIHSIETAYEGFSDHIMEHFD